MNWKERVQQELVELDAKRETLAYRLEQPQGDISDRQWELLHKQAEVMSAYGMILQERLVGE